jgi:hypothetical protein
MNNDLRYYRRRVAEETAAAAAAPSARVAAVHLELGRQYAERINALESEHRESALRLVTAA